MNTGPICEPADWESQNTFYGGVYILKIFPNWKNTRGMCMTFFLPPSSHWKAFVEKLLGCHHCSLHLKGAFYKNVFRTLIFITPPGKKVGHLHKIKDFCTAHLCPTSQRREPENSKSPWNARSHLRFDSRRKMLLKVEGREPESMTKTTKVQVKPNNQWPHYVHIEVKLGKVL